MDNGNGLGVLDHVRDLKFDAQNGPYLCRAMSEGEQD